MERLSGGVFCFSAFVQVYCTRMTFEHGVQSSNAGSEYGKRATTIGVVVLVLVGISYLVVPGILNGPGSATPCSLEMELCPDGSSVGRTGPNCEFAACPPEQSVNGSWKTVTDTATGISFRYPEALPTTYIHVVDWPPQVRVVADPFTCTAGGSEVARAGVTEERLIYDHAYCVTRESEGAAGSIYTNYAYAFAREGTTIILTFSIRSVQCANYDDPQRTACETERAAFSMDGTADAMAQSVRFPL
jgi:hypothetical protein